MNTVSFRLALAQAASGLVGGMYTPFFGAWLGWRGLAPGEIGVLLAAGMLLRVAVAPVSGLIADARNDRRGAMLVLYTVMLCGYAALNWTRTPALIFVAAVSANIAGGAITPLLESVSVRLSEVHKFDYGHVRLWASTTFVVGNIVAGLAVSRFGLVALAPWLTVVLMLNVAAVYALPTPPAGRVRGDFRIRFRATLAEARELLRSRVFLTFLACASLDQGSHAFYYGLGGLHWRALGYSGGLIGILWAARRAGRDRADVGVAARLPRHRRGAAVDAGRGRLRAALDDHGLRPPLAVVVFAQFLHGRTFAMAHLGAIVFHPEIGAAEARRDRAKPLCRVVFRHRHVAGHAGIGPALRRLWRPRLSSDGGDGSGVAGAGAHADAPMARADG